MEKQPILQEIKLIKLNQYEYMIGDIKIIISRDRTGGSIPKKGKKHYDHAIFTIFILGVEKQKICCDRDEWDKKIKDILLQIEISQHIHIITDIGYSPQEKVKKLIEIRKNTEQKFEQERQKKKNEILNTLIIIEDEINEENLIKSLEKIGMDINDFNEAKKNINTNLIPLLKKLLSQKGDFCKSMTSTLLKGVPLNKLTNNQLRILIKIWFNLKSSPKLNNIEGKLLKENFLKTFG